MRAAHIVLYGYASNDVGVQQAVKRLAPPASRSATALLIGASFFDGTAQGLLWAAAIVIDFGGPIVAGMEGWVLHPGHFAERHGLIMIIAFGESIVATGLGAEGVELTWQVVVAAMSGDRAGGGAVVGVLRRGRAGGRTSPARDEGARRRSRWRATPTATSTC